MCLPKVNIFLLFRKWRTRWMNECPSSSNTNAGKVDFFQPSRRFACECLWLRSRKMSVEEKRSSSIWPYAHAQEVRVYDSTWFHSFPRLLLMSLRIFPEKEISWKYFSIAISRDEVISWLAFQLKLKFNWPFPARLNEEFFIFRNVVRLSTRQQYYQSQMLIHRSRRESPTTPNATLLEAKHTTRVMLRWRK